ncbi:hypothetical protein [Trinickia mobilis]|uniref:hypothetical protein n=1 Tax=Trinickia mobilis TaxID=2816356 RepID=UPI001A8FF255|nr:hypothetical protein [Trinickia mobilis]
MATEFDLMLFEQHFWAALALPVAKRWNLERDDSSPLEVFCTMHPRTAPSELYKVRLRWTDYSMPFSLKFINVVSGAENDQHAWPNIEGSRPSSLFLCAPFTTEGNSYHPEWARSAATRYKTPDEPLVFALLQIQHLLDNTYLGRG